MKLKEHIKEMKEMANFLVHHTFPLVTQEEEQDILILKQRTITLDGYDLVLCYSKADYKKFQLISLQVHSLYFPYLPFNLVCRVGKDFLGTKHLSYVEFMKGNRKIYCWTVRLKNGKSVASGGKSVPASFEGLDYSILDPSSIDLH